MATKHFVSKSELRGCLKAAEANERLKDYRDKSINQKKNDIRELVKFQATALQAIRLELLMESPPVPKLKDGPTTVEDKIEQLLSEPRPPIVFL